MLLSTSKILLRTSAIFFFFAKSVATCKCQPASVAKEQYKLNGSGAFVSNPFHLLYYLWYRREVGGTDTGNKLKGVYVVAVPHPLSPVALYPVNCGPLLGTA